MDNVFLIGSFLTGFLVFYLLFNRIFSRRILITQRLVDMKSKGYLADGRDEALNKPFLERVVMPSLRWISYITDKLVPAKKNSHLERKLNMAGSPLGLKPDEFAAAYYAAMIFFAFIGLMTAVVQAASGLSMILMTAVGMLSGYGLIELWLRLKGKSRSLKIRNSLPDVLDLLTVSVEAGLGFDAALTRVIEKMKGPVSEEIAATLQEMKMGRPRREALRDLGSRSSVEELQAFVSSVIQADQLGVSIGNVLRSQSLQNRTKRRQRVEEKAMKAPIKMLFPMVMFIFPAIYVVLLAPALVQLLAVLK